MTRRGMLLSASACLVGYVVPADGSPPKADVTHLKLYRAAWSDDETPQRVLREIPWSAVVPGETLVSFGVRPNGDVIELENLVVGPRGYMGKVAHEFIPGGVDKIDVVSCTGLIPLDV